LFNIRDYITRINACTAGNNDAGIEATGSTSGKIHDSRIFDNIAADASAVEGTFSGPSLVIVNSTMNISSSRAFVHAGSLRDRDGSAPATRDGSFSGRGASGHFFEAAASPVTASNR
jgi:hypothetical protein